MVSRDRVKEVIKISREAGRLQRNQLVKVIVKERKVMSHQTANDAINDAIRLNRLISEPDQRGKQKIVFISASPEFSQDEKKVLEECETTLKKFDDYTISFKTKFPSLSTDERAEGIELFLHFLSMFLNVVNGLYFVYSRTKKWEGLIKQISTRFKEIMDLMYLNTEKEALKIFDYVVTQSSWDVSDAADEITEFMDELK